MPVIYVHATRNEVRQAVYTAVAIAAGRPVNVPGWQDLSVAISTLAGNALLADVVTDYHKKSRGQMGEDGVQWAALLPSTVYAKVRKNAKALQGPTAQAVERRKRLEEYKRRIAAERLRQRSTYPLPERGMPRELRQEIMRARRRTIERNAAHFAGYYAHRVFSDNPGVLPFALTLILIDTGVMLASLSAGIAINKYDGPSADQQNFQAIPGSVIVGTNVPYAARHQRGEPARNLPRRQWLPDPGRIPDRWWGNVLAAVAGGVQSVIDHIVRGW